jgi:hypothetical protein
MLDRALGAVQSTDPAAHVEYSALMAALIERARQRRGKPVHLPKGVELVAIDDDEGQRVYTFAWHVSSPPATPWTVRDPALAIELAWTEFMVRRPWAIDDERLRAIVQRPPASHARLLGALLSVRFVEWVRHAMQVMSARCRGSTPPGYDRRALQPLLASLDRLEGLYQARAASTSVDLGALFEVSEPEAPLVYELGRWQFMLYDYTRALDLPLHDCVEALGRRFTAEPHGMQDAWDELGRRRQLDACVGVLLAYAGMLDPGPRSSLEFVDDLATGATESFAWWCRWALDAWELDRPLGARLSVDDVEGFVGSAQRQLQALEPELLAAMVRVLPVLGLGNVGD